jgi:hypothetical protein
VLSSTESPCEDAEGWRFEQLVAVGFDVSDAWLLAIDPDVDLHQALDLLASGCPPELALQILI